MGIFRHITLIYEAQLNRLVSDLLDLLREFLSLSPFLLIGWNDQKSQEVADGIHSHVDLTATFFLMTIVACSAAALRGELKRSAIKNHRTRIFLLSLSQAQELPEVLDDGVEDTGIEPAPSLVVDGVPRGQVVRDHTPARSCFGHPSEAIEDLLQRMFPLGSVFFSSVSATGAKGPLPGRIRRSDKIF